MTKTFTSSFLLNASADPSHNELQLCNFMVIVMENFFPPESDLIQHAAFKTTPFVAHFCHFPFFLHLIYSYPPLKAANPGNAKPVKQGTIEGLQQQ